MAINQHYWLATGTKPPSNSAWLTGNCVTDLSSRPDPAALSGPAFEFEFEFEFERASSSEQVRPSDARTSRKKSII
jgi:hypothetical protein